MTFLDRMMLLLRGEVPGRLRYVPRAQAERALARATAPRRRLEARRQVIDQLLRTVAASPWCGQLVLRGSVLLRQWLGDAAREPGDVDWAVVPETFDSSFVELLLPRWTEMGPRHRLPGDPLILWGGVRVMQIWVYSPSPGLRVTFPWRQDDLSDTVQMDFSSGDTFLVPPIEADVPAGEGGSVKLLTATREQSLLWKLKWLQADEEPRAKDLYDATLLAEALAASRTPLSPDLLARALDDPAPEAPTVGAPSARARSGRATDFVENVAAEADWLRFRREHPAVTGSAREWQERLIRALSAAFEGDAGGA